jgi:hypothetical protein
MIRFYAKTFKIVGCDGFTRGFFYHSATRPVVLNSWISRFLENGFPEDSIHDCRNELKWPDKRHAYVPQTRHFKQFLNDRKVLLLLLLVETSSVFGDSPSMILHYRQMIPEIKDPSSHSGRATNALFLRCAENYQNGHAAKVGGKNADKA